MTEVPAAAVSTPPPQVDDALAGLATVMLGGKLSVKLKLTAPPALAALSIRKVRVLRAPKATTLGEKDLLKPGRSEATVRSALAVPLLPASEVKSPETLLWVPGVAEVTLSETLHDPPAPTSPPVKEIVPPPAGVETVPPQEDKTLDGSAIVIPAGKVSEKAKDLTPTPEPLAIENSNEEVLPIPMVDGVNALENVGG